VPKLCRVHLWDGAYKRQNWSGPDSRPIDRVEIDASHAFPGFMCIKFSRNLKCTV